MKSNQIRKNARRVAALTTLMIASLSGAWAHGGELYGRVVGVTDGDTITVLDDLKKPHRVRLAYIDAPETSHRIETDGSFVNSAAQPFGNAAKRYLSNLVYGKNVIVEIQEGSSYGREIGTVYVPQGDTQIDANYELVKAGYAWHYVHFAGTQPPARFSQYASAQKEAQLQRAGLWSDPAPIMPKDFRAEQPSHAAPMWIPSFR